MNRESPLAYTESARLLASYNIPLAPYRLVEDATQTSDAAQALGFPVALKAISPQMSHKSDGGLVLLNLSSPQEVAEATQLLRTRVADLPLEGILVQKMAPSGLEVIVGMTTDDQFGPLVLLGAGGVWVEILDDVAMRLPPLTRRQAEAMIRGTHLWKLLQGYRDLPPADTDALVRLLVDVSRLATAEEGRILALDLNPVIVLPKGDGVVAVDFRLVGRMP